ncbi:MAG: hypothetical protein NC926_09995 [Candidatus Omnitrophica bacterium]|nr:hypothetical protein [Candidatus Omnitrophota bacterium]
MKNKEEKIKMIICGARRGRYSKPIPLRSLKFKRKLPKKIRCHNADYILHPKQKWFPSNEMFLQKWILTKKELKEAIEEYDFFSLEMPNKIICKFCAEEVRKKNKNF